MTNSTAASSAENPLLVELGFLEEIEDARSLGSHNFPSKLGGKPAWLSFKPLPTCGQLKCKICQQPMQFLLQIYAPDYEKTSAFHRTLFLFVCRDGKCCKPDCADNFLILRCQLPRNNQFYANEASTAECMVDLQDINDFSKLCVVCGCQGEKQCSKCKKVAYCDRSHQIWHWKSSHKDQCQADYAEKMQKFQKSDNLHSNEFLFPEFEIVTETEEIFLEEKRPEKSDEEKMKEFEQYMNSVNLEAKQKENFDDLDNVKSTKTDKLFKKFAKRLEHEPEQILRYARSSEPLWATDRTPAAVPACPLCSSPRHFEFQLTPHLLSRLGVDQLGADSLDWATVAIFTCSASCDVPDFGYAPEFAWKQDFFD